MEISIVISSCDLYSDCWAPMFISLEENWADCAFPVYLICNYKDSGNKKIKAIKVGEHLGWGSNTHKAMNEIETEYVLLLQEDYFLNAPMTDNVILKHLEYCKQNNVDYLRIGEPFYDNNPTDNPWYCINPIKKGIRLTLQPAIWKRETLQKLTLEGWTGWDFERNINAYIEKNNININAQVIHSSKAPEVGYTMVHGTGIRKGIWTEGGIDFLEKHGFTEEIKGRKREGKFLTILNDVQPSSPFILPAKILRKTIQTIKRKF